MNIKSLIKFNNQAVKMLYNDEGKEIFLEGIIIRIKKEVIDGKKIDLILLTNYGKRLLNSLLIKDIKTSEKRIKVNRCFQCQHYNKGYCYKNRIDIQYQDNICCIDFKIDNRIKRL